MSCTTTSRSRAPVRRCDAYGPREATVVQGVMALDGGLIVGYLTAAALGAGRRWVDRRMDSLLDQLTDRVAGRIGRGPVDRLARNPRDEDIQRELGLTIDGAIGHDRVRPRGCPAGR
jgi:hypothetical protein